MNTLFIIGFFIFVCRDIYFSTIKRVTYHCPEITAANLKTSFVRFLPHLIEDAKITTAYCYQSQPQMLYAKIREKGIPVQESHGILTFCDPPPAEKLPWAGSPSQMPLAALLQKG